MINLQPFCAVDPYRDFLQGPFSIGEFTYATNGHIIVRVARREDVREANFKSMNAVPKLLDCHEGAEFSPFPSITWPTICETEQCRACKGVGREEDGDECFTCDGLGQVETFKKIGYRGFVWTAKYLRLISGLPHPEFAITSIGGKTAAAFRFDGGCGTLMGCGPDTKSDLGDVESFVVAS